MFESEVALVSLYLHNEPVNPPQGSFFWQRAALNSRKEKESDALEEGKVVKRGEM